MHQALLIIHLIAATVWVGGHLVLCVTILPAALRQMDPKPVLDFERRYERIAIPSLLILVVSGIWMSYLYNVPASAWLRFAHPIETIVSTKLILLLATLLLGAHGRLRIIPRLGVSNLKLIAVHIVAVTLLGLGLLTAGSFVRFGGW